jgi:hypothetical protein
MRRLVDPAVHRVARCGTIRLWPEVEVVRADDGTAHYRGVETCGSVTACPVCAAKIRRRRAEEIDEGLRRHLARGGGAAFVTLTFPHDAGMPLARLWTVVSETWRLILSGRHRQGLRALGVIGTIRAIDVTHGRHGWHPHAHVLLFLERPGAEIEELQALHRFLRERWNRRVVALGFREPSTHRGVRLLPVSAGDEVGGYLTKVGEVDEPHHTPGLELARGDLKAGRSWGSRSPFAILADWVSMGRDADRRLAEEWIVVSKGRQTLTWSRGLRALVLEDVEERSDEEIAAEEEPARVVARLDRDVWRMMLALDLDTHALEGVEAGGLACLLDVLYAHGLAVDVDERGTGPPIVRLAP